MFMTCPLFAINQQFMLVKIETDLFGDHLLGTLLLPLNFLGARSERNSTFRRPVSAQFLDLLIESRSCPP
jgi:hypothetical protein